MTHILLLVICSSAKVHTILMKCVVMTRSSSHIFSHYVFLGESIDNTWMMICVIHTYTLIECVFYVESMESMSSPQTFTATPERVVSYWF